MSKKTEDIQLLIKENKADEAMKALNRLLAEEPHNAQALFLRGKLWWRQGNRSAAMNDYAASAEIDPEGPAAMALEQARDIEAFFNPDLLNP